MLTKLTSLAWSLIEILFLIVAISVLLGLLVGKDAGYIATVTANTVELLQKIPSGTLLGIVLILVLYKYIKGKL
jgi:ABC-type proline/glycine betaine transport system permease subunit